MLSDINGPRSQGVDNQGTKAKSLTDPRQQLSGGSEAESQGKSKPQQEQGTVKLSSDAQTLKSLEAKVKAGADFDNGKVSNIRAAIDNGSYQVNAERLAEKMIDFESLLD